MRNVLENSIGLIGDVHAEDQLLQDAISRLSEAGVERILCVGDVADGPGSVERACRLLADHHIATVRGNHDRWVLSDAMRDLPDAVRRDALASGTLAYLHGLPRTLEFSSPRGRVMLCHGLGSNDMSSVGPDDFGYALESNLDLQQLLADDEIQLVFNGHTHKPMVRHFKGLTLVNAGTLFREHDPGYVIVDFSSGDVKWHGLASPTRDSRSLGSLQCSPDEAG